jgi:hypothetical protein
MIVRIHPTIQNRGLSANGLVSTREMPKGTINSFFKKLETIKRKYK